MCPGCCGLQLTQRERKRGRERERGGGRWRRGWREGGGERERESERVQLFQPPIADFHLDTITVETVQVVSKLS